jgi:hypothetical protein
VTLLLLLLVAALLVLDTGDCCECLDRPLPRPRPDMALPSWLWPVTYMPACEPAAEEAHGLLKCGWDEYAIWSKGAKCCWFGSIVIVIMRRSQETLLTGGGVVRRVALGQVASMDRVAN